VFHGKSVYALNNIFSYTTLFGVLGNYFAILYFKNYNINKSLVYIDMICFLIIEIIYLYSIHKVKDVIEDIIAIINSIKFNEKFLRREQFKNLYATTRNIPDNISIVSNVDEAKKIDIIRDISLRNLIKTHENAENIDWIVLENKLLSNWKCFDLFGFELDDSTIIQKLTTVIVGMFMIFQLNQKFNIQ
jgi:hypothetical protein